MVYGGNTSCVELTLDDKTIIIDSGTGILNLGKDLIKRKIAEATLLISHTHWDHINGFPFFMPAYQEKALLNIHAPRLNDGSSVKRIFEVQMSDPFFPRPMNTLPSSLLFHDFNSGDPFELFDGEVTVKTASLNHPNGATGYRIDYQGKSIAYISDTEHVPGYEDENIINLIRGCDFVIYDAMYTDEEMPLYRGWGHSTWQEAVRLAKKENIASFALFHHAPEHDDEKMAEIEKQAHSLCSNVFAAREGMKITLK